jgi:hypothetical protein
MTERFGRRSPIESQMPLMHFIGGTRRGYKLSCSESRVTMRRPKMFLGKPLPWCGIGPTAFSRNAVLSAPISYGIGRKQAAEWWPRQESSNQVVEDKAGLSS